MPNVFGNADDILDVGYDDNSREHDNILKSTTNMQRRKSEYYKVSFQMFVSPIFGDMVSRHGMKPDP